MQGPLLRLDMPRRLEREFKRQAKAVFPRECYGILLGTVAGDSVVVDEIWIPPVEELRAFATPTEVTTEGVTKWYLDAIERAREEDLTIVGDVHSHPYPWSTYGGQNKDRTQSESDLESQEFSNPLVCGICTISEQAREGGRLRASFRWWGRTISLETRYTK